jgi:formate dehydrogenase major subunit
MERRSRLVPKGSARTVKADRVARSVCPYCGVGCGQLVYVEKERITDIEGDPDSPISEGALCPKGSATFQLVTGAHRHDRVLYRRPHGTEWEQISLEDAMEMVAQRVKASREATWRRRFPTVAGSTARTASCTSAAPRSTTRRTT